MCIALWENALRRPIRPDRNAPGTIADREGIYWL
jgi:hypothetical protein